MNEISLLFGSDRHLCGTLTLPPAGQTAKLGVVLLNAGVIHRIGPHRFNVKLARSLAGSGVVTLRMDLSGQGDSGTSSQPAPFEEQAVVDLRAAMDHVQRVCQVDRFVIAGICSGAFNGLATAMEDHRVVGLWMLDGYVYPTPKTDLVRYQSQLAAAPIKTLGSWTRSAFKRIGSTVDSMLNPSPAPTSVDYGFRTPPKEVFGQQIQSLVDRGTSVYMVYSGSMLWKYNYPEQLRDAFAGYGFVEQVRCDHIPGIDHTMTTLASQQLVIQRIRSWIDEIA